MMEPLVTVITPFGSKHRRIVGTAVASVFNQSLGPAHWRMTLIDDSKEQAGPDMPAALLNHPNVTVLYTGGGKKSATARNVGIATVGTPYLLFLDADDYLVSGALIRVLEGHLRHDRAYSFSDHYAMRGEGETAIAAHLRPPEYHQETYRIFNIHTITALVLTENAMAVGGFDTKAPGWEDWTFWLRMARAGYCGKRVPGPLFVYRADESVNHPVDVAGGQALMDAVIRPYLTPKGEFTYMACGCSGGASTARQQIAETLMSIGRKVDTMSDLNKLSQMPVGSTVKLEFIGEGQGTRQFRSPMSGRTYRAGNNALWRELHNVPVQDAMYLVDLKLFQIKVEALPFEPPPNVEGVAETFGTGSVDDAITPEDHPETEIPALPLPKTFEEWLATQPRPNSDKPSQIRAWKRKKAAQWKALEMSADFDGTYIADGDEEEGQD